MTASAPMSLTTTRPVVQQLLLSLCVVVCTAGCCLTLRLPSGVVGVKICQMARRAALC